MESSTSQRVVQLETPHLKEDHGRQLLALYRALADRYRLSNECTTDLSHGCLGRSMITDQNPEAETNSEALRIGLRTGELMVLKPAEVLRRLIFGIERGFCVIRNVEQSH